MLKENSSNAHEGGMLWLELTNGCNLTCSHCYSDSFPGSQCRDILSYDDYLKAVVEGGNIGFSRIQFIGGEPLLYKKINELITSAEKCGYKSIEIFSNLSFIPERLFDVASTIPLTIHTSIYSNKSEIHDSITDVVGSYDNTISNIKKLVNIGVEVNAAFIEMESNLGEFQSVRESMKSIGVTEVYMDRAREFGRESASEKQHVGELCGACSGNTACVSYDGNLYPCIMSKMLPIGSLLESSMASLLNSEANYKHRSLIFDETAKSKETIHANCGPQGLCGPTGVPTCGPQGNCGPSGTHCRPHVKKSQAIVSERNIK